MKAQRDGKRINAEKAEDTEDAEGVNKKLWLYGVDIKFFENCIDNKLVIGVIWIKRKYYF